MATPWTVDRRTSGAIAQIKVISGGNVVSRGTGFLVGRTACLTALHVVANRKATPPAVVGDRIELHFVSGLVTAKLGAHIDPVHDWALLECETPPDAMPLPISELDTDDERWATWGFPDLNRRDGKTFEGSFLRRDATFENAAVYELATSGANGVPIAGLSGGPLLVDGSVVGIIRAALMEPGDGGPRVLGDTLYASPITSAIEACGSLLPPQESCRGLPPLVESTLPPTPFRYLSTFAKTDGAVFFGRCREIRALYDRLLDPENGRVVALYGPTGVGKSSVLQAGLIPRLTDRMTVVTVARDASIGVQQSCARAVGADSFADGWLALERREGKPALVILDQLEEVFTRPRPSGDELAELASAITEAVAKKPRGTLLIGFRKEWLAEIERAFQTAGVDLDKVFLERLDEHAIREIVEGLTRTARLRKRYQLTVEDGLAEEMAAGLLGGVSPVAPTLQILLTRMWEAATKASLAKPAFTKALYRSVAREGDYLREYLGEQLKTMAARCPQETSSGLVLDLLQFHVTPRGTSEQRSKADLVAAYGNRLSMAERVVTESKSLYLLSDPADDAATHLGDTRLIHDTLAPHVMELVARSQYAGQRASRILASRVAEWSDDSKQQRPLDAGDLAVVERGEKGMRTWNTTERAIVALSRRSRRSAQVARWVGRGVLAALSAAILITGVLMLAAQKRIKELEPLPHSIAANAFCDESRKHLEGGHPELALQFAASAIEMALDNDDRLPFYVRLLIGSSRHAPRSVMQLPDDVIAFAPDLDGLFTLTDGALTKLSLTEEPLWKRPTTFKSLSQFSQDGSMAVAIADVDAKLAQPVEVIDVATGKTACTAALPPVADTDVYATDDAPRIIWNSNRRFLAILRSHGGGQPYRWNIVDCQTSSVFDVKGAAEQDVAVTASAVVYVDKDNKLCTQPLPQGAPVCAIHRPGEIVHVVASSTRIFVETRRPTAVVEWTATGSKPIYEDVLPREDRLLTLDVSPDGSQLLLDADPKLDNDGHLSLVDTATRRRIPLGYGNGTLMQAGFSRDGTTIMALYKATGEKLRQSVFSWRTRDGAPLVKWIEFPLNDDVAFSRDGMRLVDTTGGIARFWDIGRLATSTQFRRGPIEPSEHVDVALFSPSGSQLVLVKTDNEHVQVCAWDVERMAQSWCRRGDFEDAIAFSASGRRVLVLERMGQSSKLWLLDAATGQPIGDPDVVNERIENIGFDLSEDTFVLQYTQGTQVVVTQFMHGAGAKGCVAKISGEQFMGWDRDGATFMTLKQDHKQLVNAFWRVSDCSRIWSVFTGRDMPNATYAWYQQRIGFEAGTTPMLMNRWGEWRALLAGRIGTPLRAGGAWIASRSMGAATISDDGGWMVSSEGSTTTLVLDTELRQPIGGNLATERQVIGSGFYDGGDSLEFVTRDGDVSRLYLGPHDKAGALAAKRAGLGLMGAAFAGAEVIGSDERVVQPFEARGRQEAWKSSISAMGPMHPAVQHVLDEQGTSPPSFP